MVWQNSTLGEIYDVRDGTHDSPKYQDHGYPLVTSKNLKSGVIDLSKVNYISRADYLKISERSGVSTGDVLMAMIGTIGNPVLISDEPNFAIKNVALFKVPKNQDGKFLKYYLESKQVVEKMLDEAKGTTQKFVGLGYLRNFPILSPSCAEQKQIVAILDEAFANIDRARQLAERNLKNARELFDSTLKAIFESVTGNQFANKDLEALCELIVDCEHKTAPTEATGYPSIRTPNIKRGILSLENVNKVSEETYQEWTRRAVPLPGDLIMAREAPAGNVAVIPGGIQPCLGQRTLLIRPKSEIFISEYLMWYLLSPEVQTRLLSTSRGATVQHVNMKDIRALEIKYIPELSEQKRIADSIEDIRLKTKKLEAIYQQKITALDELKQSLLQKAFRGELTQNKAAA